MSSNYLKRLLNTIEGLALLWQDGPKNIVRAEDYLSEIYRYAHLAGKCKNPHTNWQYELLKTEKDLEKIGIINCYHTKKGRHNAQK